MHSDMIDRIDWLIKEVKGLRSLVDTQKTVIEQQNEMIMRLQNKK